MWDGVWRYEAYFTYFNEQNFYTSKKKASPFRRKVLDSLRIPTIWPYIAIYLFLRSIDRRSRDPGQWDTARSHAFREPARTAL